MNKKQKRKTTETADMVPSTFNWLTPTFQSKRSKQLSKITEKKS